MIKVAMFTDIHFGRRGNERQHNQDCLNFVSWFCEQVRAAKPSHIAFLGDWFESRNAINIETMHYSHKALQLLNELDIPVMFIVGNHDLHRRTTREIHSVSIFNELANIKVVDEPTVVDGMLFSPYLFDHEYAKLAQWNTLPAWFGHFEFKGFAITGHNTLMEHGPDHKLFNGPKKIFSGHFHKRQVTDNVVYIGNTFCMDYGDAGDSERGCAIYDVSADEIKFINWEVGPSFLKIKLDDLVSERWAPRPGMKVKCVINTEISYSDVQELREQMIKQHSLRDFVLEEDRETKQGLVAGDSYKVDEIYKNEFTSIDELVTQQLVTAKDDPLFNKKYNIDTLVEIYKSLKIELKEGEAS